MVKKKFPLRAFLTEDILGAPLRIGARLLSLPRRPLAYPGGYIDVPPPIFVIGPPGCGASALGAALNRHSRVACPGETWFLAGLIEQLRNGYFVRGLQGLGVWREETVANIRGFALSYYGRFLERAGKPRCADTSSAYSAYSRELRAVFGPTVKVIQVLRHGLDVVDWMRDRDWFMLMPPVEPLDARTRLQAAALLWRKAADSARSFQAAHPSSCLTIRFEDLAARPEPVLREVLAFLGEPFEPNLVEAAEAEVQTLSSSTGGYRRWPPEDLRVVRDVMDTALVRHGYDAGP